MEVFLVSEFHLHIVVVFGWQQKYTSNWITWYTSIRNGAQRSDLIKLEPNESEGFDGEGHSMTPVTHNMIFTDLGCLLWKVLEWFFCLLVILICYCLEIRSCVSSENIQSWKHTCSRGWLWIKMSKAIGNALFCCAICVHHSRDFTRLQSWSVFWTCRESCLSCNGRTLVYLE